MRVFERVFVHPCIRRAEILNNGLSAQLGERPEPECREFG